MNSEARKTALSKLTDSRRLLVRYSNNNIKPGEVKLGNGLNNLVVGEDFVQTNLDHPSDVGFHFSPEGSDLRHGNHLDMDGDYKKFFFKGGEQQLNPLGDVKASSTTDPLPTIMPSLRGISDAFLSGELKSLISVIDSL